MSPALDDLLARLRQQPLDHSLDGVTASVDLQLAESAAISGQTWRLRAAAIALFAAGGAIFSASTASAIAVPKSPFAAWSLLAPSTLLEPSE
jgi:hypothetical protein